MHGSRRSIIIVVIEAIGSRITFLGHSTLLLELDGVRLLTDPVLRRRILHIKRHARVPDEALTGRVDAILVSHAHADHLDPRSLRRVDRSARAIAPEGARRALRRAGREQVTHLAPGESARVGAIEIAATPAEHDGRRWPVGSSAEAIGFVVSGSHRIYFAGDTDMFEGIGALGGDLDVALLPVGGWGPNVGVGHLDARSAAEAAALLRPRIAVPIHWGAYLRMGLGHRTAELLHRPPREFAEHLAELAPDVEARVLEPGESLEL